MGFIYQFLRCTNGSSTCKTISHKNRIVLVAADVNSTIEAKVTARNNFGNTSVMSSPLVVVGRAPSNTVAPYINGLARPGNELVVGAGKWTGFAPITFTYQFLSCGAKKGACTLIYTEANRVVLTTAEVGSVIRAKVVAHNAFGGTTAFSSNSLVVR